MKNGVLIEVKGDHSNFVDPSTGKFHKWFTGKQGLIAQARRQKEASEGAPIRWYFNDEASLRATKALFEKERILGIEFILQPMR